MTVQKSSTKAVAFHPFIERIEDGQSGGSFTAARMTIIDV